MQQILLIIMIFLLIACQAAPEVLQTEITTVIPTVRPAPIPTGWQVQIHPGEPLYVGDIVSFEVFTSKPVITQTKTIDVLLAGTPRSLIGSAEPTGFGIGNRWQATLTWSWDTHELEPGDQDIVFSIRPDGPVFTQTLTLLPAAEMPSLEASSEWAFARSECCTIYYLTNTEAERDLPQLLTMLDKQANLAAERMGVDFGQLITITLMPRLLGHGGFADEAIHVTYLDRNPAGGLVEMLIHHEMIHILDYRMGGDLRPIMLVEGLAVYQSGGHFKPESLMPRAAALLDRGETSEVIGHYRYIAIRELVDSFYTSQHEIGYLRAGALVEYMIGRWGWAAFNSFYRDIHPVQNASQAAAMENALERHFALTLEELDTDFQAALRAFPVDSFLAEDVRLTVLHFDTLRRYQQVLDPAGYFLTAWLVNERVMRNRGITADYLRRPEAPLNVSLELLMGASSVALHRGQLEDAEEILGVVNSVLNAVESGETYPAAVDGLAFAVFERVGWLDRRGLSPQTLAIEKDWLQFGVRLDGLTFQTLRLPRRW